MLTKIITFFALARAVTSNILEAELNYQKPKLERNNILNKGVWVRHKLKENLFDKTRIGDFVFRENSLDVDNLLQNTFDPFGVNYMDDNPRVSNYIKRAKRAIRRIREQRLRKSLKNCIGKDCQTYIIEEQNELMKEPVKKDGKGGRSTTSFNDYPFEVAILLNNNKRQADTLQNDTNSLENDVNENDTFNKSNDINKKPDFSVETEDNNNTMTKNTTAPRRSKKYDFESEVIKKFEFTEDVNKSRVNNEQNEVKIIDRNIFDKDNTVWHQNAPIPDVNVYKVVPKEPKKSKPVTERGLIKVISMLTKTFKKIMKQHTEIKDIYERISDINDHFVKNTGLVTEKFQDFDAKYLNLLKFHDKLKIFDAKLATKQEYFKNKEREMASNFKEFENQQKKFLQQQRQFYNIQKLMLAQNEKINIKQNVIAKTQSEISHRQNNFARILKKAKQLFLENKIPTTKLNLNMLKPSHNNKPTPIPKISTTTPSTESVKINLFSIPTSNKIENQDDMIIKEKDDQTIDDLVYKFYFNNTFIDSVMKNNVLTSLMGVSHNPGMPRNVKSKRNELETTILLPVYEGNDSEESVGKNRERRWITHHSRRRGRKHHRGKGGAASILNSTDAKPIRKRVHSDGPIIEAPFAPIANSIPLVKKDIPKKEVTNSPVVTEAPKANDDGDKAKKDPFLAMAENFCNEIKQNVDKQMLSWCVEKALRRLRFLDMKNVPTEISTSTSTAKPLHELPTTISPTQPETPNKIEEPPQLLTERFTMPNTLGIEMVKDFVPTVKTETPVVGIVPVVEIMAPSSTLSSTPTSTTVANTTTVESVTQVENATTTIGGPAFFPDNEMLESNLKPSESQELSTNLKQYDLKPDVEGNVYYDGSIHASDILFYLLRKARNASYTFGAPRSISRLRAYRPRRAKVGSDSQGIEDDIMPGLESNSRVEMDPLAFDLQAQRRAIVRKLNEKLKMSLG